MAAYRVKGNLENAVLWPKFDVTGLGDEVFRYLPERFEPNASIRTPPASLPEWFAFEVQPPDDLKYRYYVADAISSTQPTLGLGTFVSMSARDKLAPILGDECTFLPVEIDNAPEPYFAMWVRNLVPALDLRRARVTKLTHRDPKRGKYPLRIDSFEFQDDLLQGRYLFRLPGLDYAEESLQDFATSAFVELVKDLKISGFQYFSATTVPAFSPRRADQ